jgi:hypothetical protein
MTNDDRKEFWATFAWIVGLVTLALIVGAMFGVWVIR